MKLEIGDLVTLKSGGPTMTVVAVCDTPGGIPPAVDACWFPPDWDNAPRSARFPVDALTARRKTQPDENAK